MPGKDKSEGASKASSASARKPAHSLISQEKLLQLYATMVKCQVLDESFPMFAPQSKTSGVCEAGREASLVGATIDLERGDAIVPARWGFLAELARGVLPETTVRKLAARVKRGNVSRRSATVQLEPAIRAATIRKREQKSRIVVAFTGADQTMLPSWRKLTAMAARQKLPIVFVVQAQRMAGFASQVGKDGSEGSRPRVAVRGLPVIVVDGDDAVAVYRVAYEAIARARRGLGPTLIECEPYILEGKNDRRRSKSRRKSAAEDPQGADAIAKMEIYLGRKGLLAPEARLRIETAFNEELGFE
jgi:TPP-dependent pyruvate/acetoin dehydrogenase alpha subunit